MVEVGSDNHGIGAILREMREAAKLKPNELALKIGCDKSHIYRLENGEADPSLSLAKRWVLVTKPSLPLLLSLLVPSEYLRWYRNLRRSSGKDGN